MVSLISYEDTYICTQSIHLIKEHCLERDTGVPTDSSVMLTGCLPVPGSVLTGGSVEHQESSRSWGDNDKNKQTMKGISASAEPWGMTGEDTFKKTLSMNPESQPLFKDAGVVKSEAGFMFLLFLDPMFLFFMQKRIR